MTSSTPFKASSSSRKSPFARPPRPESPSSPSPLRPSPLRTATPILHPEDSPLKPASPLRNSTNRISSPVVSSPVADFEDKPAVKRPDSALFASPAQAPENSSPAKDSPTKIESPLRQSTSIPSVNIFEDSFSPAKLDPAPQLETPAAFEAPANPTFSLRQASSEMSSTPRSDSWTPRGLRPVSQNLTPTKSGSLASKFETSRDSTPNKSIASTASPATSKRPSYGARAMSESNALSKLQPSQVRELRECFQILDRDSDGVVVGEDVKDMLNQLGLPSSDGDVESFFPSGDKQTSTMAVFLTQISTLLATLSPPAELLNAFSAFDDDDSGQVDLAELRDALLHTIPDQGEQALTPSEVDRVLGGFSGRRALGKTMMGGKRGEVFKYQEFVNSIAGGKDKGAVAAEE